MPGLDPEFWKNMSEGSKIIALAILALIAVVIVVGKIVVARIGVVATEVEGTRQKVAAVAKDVTAAKVDAASANTHAANAARFSEPTGNGFARHTLDGINTLLDNDRKHDERLSDISGQMKDLRIRVGRLEARDT